MELGAITAVTRELVRAVSRNSDPASFMAWPKKKKILFLSVMIF